MVDQALCFWCYFRTEIMMSRSVSVTPMVPGPCKPRARLTEVQAVDIFKMRSPISSAVNIAKRFGVSEKTVRDIWKGRTWSRETCHLDTSRTVVLKQVGRPKGRTDMKPRKKRSIIEHLFSSYNRHEPQLSSGGSQVDEQLSSWTETLWISSSNPDPFRDDWAPISCHTI